FRNSSSSPGVRGEDRRISLSGQIRRVNGWIGGVSGLLHNQQPPASRCCQCSTRFNPPTLNPRFISRMP
ncbi:hypothetical protein LLE87_36435, partial [Paenibacillus polymyxa]|nr:hypothetical protein [Paenibacillus polymyxa]